MTIALKFAEDYNLPQLFAPLLPGTVTQLEKLIQNVNNPILIGDYKLLLKKLKELSKEFEQGKGNTLKLKLFDLNFNQVLSYFVSSL